MDLLQEPDCVLPDDARVLVNIQIEDVIVDEPERHLSRYLSRRHTDVQELSIGGLVQLFSDVQRRSRILIV